MPCDYSVFPHAGIQSLSPYIPGKSTDELAREQGLTDIIKLASNENPLGCSHLVTKALATLSPHQIATYAIPLQHPLRKKLATELCIDEDMLTLTSGSEAIIPLLQTCFALHNEKHILIPAYSFISYGLHAKTLGIPFISTPVLSNWQVDINALIAACNEKTALIFIANPNNPTGSMISQIEIERLLANIPTSTLLVLDEAYYEFVPDNHKVHTMSLLNKHDNLIITRTFSKAYGLAGLRLGYTICNSEVSRLIQRILPPFTVNEAALVAGSAALDDQAFLEKTIKNNEQGLKQIQQGLAELGINYLPTAANFITFDCKSDGSLLFQKLLQRGIILRPLHPYDMNNYLRVTVGTEKQNFRFIDNLKELQYEK